MSLRQSRFHVSAFKNIYDDSKEVEMERKRS